MQTYDLISHPTFQPGTVKSVSAQAEFPGNGVLVLRYTVTGCEKLVVPPRRDNSRSDDLWKTTCFELFLYDGGGRYREFNFSPSGQWAGYEFSGYRNRDCDADLREIPDIAIETGEDMFVQTVRLPLSILDRADRCSISAVIEEQGGRPSYWALAHAGLKPDFHAPACFAAPVPAPRNP